MSLDVTLLSETYTANITHNLNKMAMEAGIYKELWRPEELGYSRAWELINPLSEGLIKLLDDPERYKAFNPINGWGSYEDFVSFVNKYLNACRATPNATIHISR